MTFKQAFESFITETQNVGLMELKQDTDYKFLSDEEDKLVDAIKEALPKEDKYLIKKYYDDILVKLRTMELDKAYLDGHKNMLRLLLMILRG